MDGTHVSELAPSERAAWQRWRIAVSLEHVMASPFLNDGHAGQIKQALVGMMPAIKLVVGRDTADRVRAMLRPSPTASDIYQALALDDMPDADIAKFIAWLRALASYLDGESDTPVTHLDG